MAITVGDLLVDVEAHLRNRPQLRPHARRWLNRSQRIICRSNPWSFTVAEDTALSDLSAPSYNKLPDDFFAPVDVRVKNASGVVSSPLDIFPVNRVDERFPDQTKSANAPTVACFTGGTMLLVPPFNNTASTIILRFHRTPPRMDFDDQIPLVPEIFRDVMVDGALAVGARWLWDDKGEQDRIKAEFVQGVLDMLRIEKGDIDHQDQMRVSSSVASMLDQARSDGFSTDWDA